MNWTDIGVLVIIVIFTAIGMRNGFLYSVFRLLSYILSVIFAIKFYPVLSAMLQKTVIYTNIKASIISGIVRQQSADGLSLQERTAQSIVDSLRLPGFIKEAIIENVGKKDVLGFQKITEAVGSEIATLVINIMSMILIYLIIRFGLIFARVIIRTIAKLPVFKQLDKAGGFVLGAIEGIFMVYILCALLVLFSAFPKFSPVIDSVRTSQFASYFYQNNFIVSFLSPEHQQEQVKS
ncbi:CvpA family protein [Ruminiclostridium cellobioparum]|jgi:uncharacterized membrane protein required for colicin V production|uniref:CvpA family protein n=1 Tax=Ruminiclostridium cellobioparum TaxID=29355 RepID=UPI0028A6E21B|nr:CvpA family protein [Ruminiclostridium cellobioparum]